MFKDEENLRVALDELEESCDVCFRNYGTDCDFRQPASETGCEESIQ